MFRPRLEVHVGRLCLQLPTTWHCPEGGNTNILRELPSVSMRDFLTLSEKGMERLQAYSSNSHVQTQSTILMCKGCKEPCFLKWLIVLVFCTEVKEGVFYFSKKIRTQMLPVPEAWGLAPGTLLLLSSSVPLWIPPACGTRTYRTNSTILRQNYFAMDKGNQEASEFC